MSNIKCLDCGQTINPTANTHACQPIGSTTSFEVKCAYPFHGVKMNKPRNEDDPKCLFHPSDNFSKRDGTLTPLGEASQSNCPRCNQRWIMHDCPIVGGGISPRVNASEVIKLAEEIINKPNVLDSCSHAKKEFQKFKDRVCGNKSKMTLRW